MARTHTLHNTATNQRDIQPPQAAPEILRRNQPSAKFAPAKRAQCRFNIGRAKGV